MAILSIIAFRESSAIWHALVGSENEIFFREDKREARTGGTTSLSLISTVSNFQEKLPICSKKIIEIRFIRIEIELVKYHDFT